MRASEQPCFTLDDVEQVLPLKSWWAMLLVLPVVRRLTVLIVNRTKLTPNFITVLSILLRLFAAGCFVSGTHPWLIAGAVAYYASYVLDCMDGAVARLKKLSSEFGRYLDHMGDLVGGLCAVAGLAAGQDMLVSFLAGGLLLCHMSEYYISYLTSNLIKAQKVNLGSAETKVEYQGPLKVFGIYRRYFHSRNMKSFFSFPDYEATVFLLFPLLGMPSLGLEVGFCLALLVTMYTISSSFFTLHSGGTQFP